MTSNQKPKCWLCDNEEIINESCTRCHKAFCSACMSRFDHKFCDDCLRDIQVKTGVMDGKTEIEWNEENGETIISRGHKCKVIQFQGIDWQFVQHRIHNIPDKELSEELEVHRAYVFHMASELASRTVKSIHQTPAPPKKAKLSPLASGKKAKIQAKTPEQIMIEKLLAWAEKQGISSSEQMQAFLERNKKI